MTPLEHEITELWGHITAATHRFLTLVAEFDQNEGWNGEGITNCAHWLNVYCGIGIVAAREKVRVAHAIGQLPKINLAFGEGRVSYSKVRAMTRVATPENEDLLLNIALHGTAAHVERTVQQYRRAKLREESGRAAAAEQHRFLDIRFDDDDTAVISGRVPAEVGELLRAAIDCAMDQATDDSAESSSATENPQDSVPEGALADDAVPEDAYPAGAKRADALRAIAAQFLSRVDDAPGSTAGRYQVVVHLDQQLLSHSHESGADVDADTHIHLCEYEDAQPLAIETARRLACDASVVGMLDDEDGEPLSVGRKTRAIPPAIARALKARDGGCRFPGCHHTRFTEGHHIKHWANGGETKLSNLITLCHHHHHLVHEGGFRVARTDDGLFVFCKPDGTRLSTDFAVEGRFRGSAVIENNRQREIRITPATIATRWRGEAMDYSLAIEGLLRRSGREIGLHRHRLLSDDRTGSVRDRDEATETDSCRALSAAGCFAAQYSKSRAGDRARAS